MEILNRPGLLLMEVLGLVGLKIMEVLKGWDLTLMKSSKGQDPQQLVKIFVNGPAHYSLVSMLLQTVPVFWVIVFNQPNFFPVSLNKYDYFWKNFSTEKSRNKWRNRILNHNFFSKYRKINTPFK